MFEELFPIEIGKVGPGPRLRLRHVGVNSVYESGARLSTINLFQSAISRAPRAATKPPSAPRPCPGAAPGPGWREKERRATPGRSRRQPRAAARPRTTKNMVHRV